MKTTPSASSVIAALFIVTTQLRCYSAPSCDTVRCRSHGRKYRTCDVDVRLGKKVTLKYEDRLSKESCRKDQSYGVSRGRIWVDRSCKAYFRVCGQQFRRQSNECELLKCESKNKRHRRCFADKDLGPQLTMSRRDRLSSRPCHRGRSYGLRGRHVWVDKGCKAYFRVCGKVPSELANKIPTKDANIRPTQATGNQSTPAMLLIVNNQIQASRSTSRPPKLVPHYDSDVADTKVDMLKYPLDESLTEAQRGFLGDWMGIQPVVEYKEEEPFESFLPVPSNLSMKAVVLHHSSLPMVPVDQLPVRMGETPPANLNPESKYVTPPGYGTNKDILIDQLVNLLSYRTKNRTVSSSNAPQNENLTLPTNMPMLLQMMRDAFKRKRLNEQNGKSSSHLVNRVQGKQLVKTSDSMKLDPLHVPSNDLPSFVYKQPKSKNSGATKEISNSISNIPTGNNDANVGNLGIGRMLNKTLGFESVGSPSAAGMPGMDDVLHTANYQNNELLVNGPANYQNNELLAGRSVYPPLFDSARPPKRVFDAPILSLDDIGAVDVALPGVNHSGNPQPLNTDNRMPWELVPPPQDAVLPPNAQIIQAPDNPISRIDAPTPPTHAGLFPIADQSFSSLYLISSSPPSDSSEHNSPDNNYDTLTENIDRKPMPTNFISNTPRFSESLVQQLELTTTASLSIPRQLSPQENIGAPNNIPESVMPLEDSMSVMPLGDSMSVIPLEDSMSARNNQALNSESTRQTFDSGLSLTPDRNSDFQDSFRSNSNTDIAALPLTDSILRPSEIPAAIGTADPGYSKMEAGPSMPNPGYSKTNSGLTLPNPDYNVTDTGLSSSDPGYSRPMPDPGLTLQDPGLRLPDPGYSMTDPGLTLQDPGLSLPDLELPLHDSGLSLPVPEYSRPMPDTVLILPDAKSSLPEAGTGGPDSEVGRSDSEISPPASRSRHAPRSRSTPRENDASIDRLISRTPDNVPQAKNSRRRVSSAARAYIRRLIAARRKAARRRPSNRRPESRVQLFQCIGTNACSGGFRVRF